MLGRALAITLLPTVLLFAACTTPLIKANPAPTPTTVSIKVAPPTIAPARATSTPKPEPAIVVTAPIAGQLVRTPVRVAGTAVVFEGNVQMVVKDASGKVLGRTYTTASAGAPLRGTFSADITFTQPVTAQVGTVEVFDLSAKDGSVRDLVAVKINLAGR